jgi:putative endonuclease
MRSSDSRRRATRRGAWAETFCCWWLRARGFRILARDVRTKVGEIDIVARRGDLLVFAEVKARVDMATALGSVGDRQKQRISRAAAWYLRGNPALGGHRLRFDVFAVAPWRLPVHIENAWIENAG